MPLSIDKLNSLHQALGERYDRLAGLMHRSEDELQLTVDAISSWSVAEQMHHIASSTALMLAGVMRIAGQVSPAKLEGRISAMGRAVLMSGRFPRGKGKAPARTMPPETVSREELETAVARSRRMYDSVAEVLEKAAVSDWKVEHPYFGMLNAEQWLKLAAIHADHHFRIIEDIDSAA
ncbi:MAG: DUF1569 domain-containing protein [Rhodothermales bacterium]|nr:DUF1569 domain-containing protein [Rhodothermales bacterium]